MLKKLEWDSNFFGQQIYECDLVSIAETAQLPQGAFVQIKVNSEDTYAQALVESQQFNLLDYHLEYALELLVASTSDDDQQLVIAQDIKTSKSEQAGALFVENSRFHIYTDNQKIVEFYNEWLQKSKFGNFDDELLIYCDRGEEVGFSTTRYGTAHEARIGLFGILPDFQGQGYGKRILSKLFAQFQKKGVSQVLIATQGKNKNAQKLYEATGFKMVSKQAIYCKKIGE